MAGLPIRTLEDPRACSVPLTFEAVSWGQKGRDWRAAGGPGLRQTLRWLPGLVSLSGDTAGCCFHPVWEVGKPRLGGLKFDQKSWVPPQAPAQLTGREWEGHQTRPGGRSSERAPWMGGPRHQGREGLQEEVSLPLACDAQRQPLQTVKGRRLVTGIKEALGFGNSS